MDMIGSLRSLPEHINCKFNDRDQEVLGGNNRMLKDTEAESSSSCSSVKYV